MKKENRPALAEIVESFFRDRLAAQRKASPETVAAYKTGLRMLFVFAAERAAKRPAELRVDDDLQSDVILAFLDHLEANRGNSARTRNARLAAIKSFFHYASYKDPTIMGLAHRIRQIPAKRFVRKVIHFLSKEEVEALLAVPDKETQQGQRDHAFLLFLARTGARVSEAIRVCWDDVRLQRPWQVLLHGKGSKERVVLLDEPTVHVLEQWHSRHQGNGDSPVFLNARGQKGLTRFGAIHVIGRTLHQLAVRRPDLVALRVTPHTFRHTNAMHMLQAGVDLTTIRSWLGHVSVDTTHQYIEADLEMKQRAIDKCTPLNTTPGKFIPPDELLAMLERL